MDHHRPWRIRLAVGATLLAWITLSVAPTTPVASAATVALPSPTGGQWVLSGTAVVVSSPSPARLQLTDAAPAGQEAGLAYYPTAVPGPGLSAAFDATIGGGSGADGLTFALADASAGPPGLGAAGGGLGFSGMKGLAVALDTYQNSQNPSANFVGVATGAGPASDTLSWGATSTSVPNLRAGPVHVVVTTTSSRLTVSVAGVQVLAYAATIPSSVYVAFTGADGGLTDAHSVSNVSIKAAGGGTALTGPASELATYLQNNSRTSYNPGETGLTAANAPTLKPHWVAKGGAGGFSQPVISNGVAYWGDWNGNEHATRTADGVDLWATNLGTTTPPASDGCLPASAGIVATATVGQVGPTTVVYVAGGNATMSAINAANGSVLWRTSLGPAPDFFIWGSPGLANNSVYVGVASYGDCPLVRNSIVRMDADTGAVLNSFATVPAGCVGGGMTSSPAIDPADGSVYIATGTRASCPSGEPYSEALLKLTANLSLVSSWQIPPNPVGDSDFVATPTLFTTTIGGTPMSMVGLANKNGIYYAFDRTTVATGPVWQQVIADNSGRCPQCNGAGGSIVPSAFDGSTLFVAGGATTIAGSACPGGLAALDPATGAFKWRACLTASVLGAVTEVPGVVVIGYGNHLLVANAATGASLFDYTSNTASFFWGAANVSNGVVYAVNMNGNLYAFGQ